MRKKIVLYDVTMMDMTLEEQEAIWLLSKSCEVYEMDKNGCKWMIVDLTNKHNRKDSIKMNIRSEEENCEDILGDADIRKKV